MSKNPLEGIIDDIKRHISRGIDELKNRVNSLPEAVKASVSNEISKVNDGIGKWIDEVKRQIENTINNAHAVSRDIINRVGSSIEQVVNATRANVVDAVNTVKLGFDRSVAAVSSTVSQAIDLTKTTVNAAIEGARTAVERSIAATTANITAAVNYAQNAVQNAQNLIKSGIDVSVALARDTVKNAVDNAASLVRTAVEGATQNVYRVVDFARNAIENIALGIRNAIQTTIETTTAHISRLVGLAYDGVRTIGHALIDAVKNSTAFFVEKAAVLLLNVRERIDKTIENITTALQNARKAVEERIRELVQFILQKTAELLQYADKYYKQAREFIEKTIDTAYKNLQKGSAQASGQIRSAIHTILSGNYNDIDGAINAINEIVGLEEFSKFLLYALAATTIFGAALPTVAFPYLQNVQNRINANVLPGTIDISLIAEAAGKGIIDSDIAANWAGRLGISAAMLNAALLAGKQYLSPQEAANAYLAGLIEQKDYITALRLDNRYVEIADTLVELARQRLNVSQVFDAVSYGLWSETQATDELLRQGYTPERISALRASYYNTLSEQDIRDLYLRNIISKDERDHLLRRIRYDDRSITLSYALDNRIPPLSDLVRFGIKDVFNEEFAQKYGLDEEYPQEFQEYAGMLGIAEKVAKWYWRSGWDLPSPTMGYEMYHRGLISRDELAFLLKISDYPVFWREKMIEMAYNPLTRVDVRRMYQLGVMTREDVKKAYLDLGYSPENAELLTRFTETLKQSDETDTDEVRRLSRTEILKALTVGVMTTEDAKTALKELGYADTDIETLVKLAIISRKPERNEPVINDHFQRIRRLTARLYADDYISRKTALEMLVDAGYSRENAELELALVEREDDYNDDEEITKALFRMYEQRVIDDKTLKQLLREIVVVEENKINEMVERQGFLRELRAELPSLTDMRKWVKNGLIDRDGYEEYLKARGIAEKYLPYYLLEAFGE